MPETAYGTHQSMQKQYCKRRQSERTQIKIETLLFWVVKPYGLGGLGRTYRLHLQPWQSSNKHYVTINYNAHKKKQSILHFQKRYKELTRTNSFFSQRIPQNHNKNREREGEKTNSSATKILFTTWAKQAARSKKDIKNSLGQTENTHEDQEMMPWQFQD